MNNREFLKHIASFAFSPTHYSYFHMSFPRQRESRFFKPLWIPTFVGTMGIIGDENLRIVNLDRPDYLQKQEF
ncbi:MAG: hypothetical protein BWK79_06255 [Beggiatoa sp. IS2]|nr:MAG: hypothetical protein BWK79_06255 [Beggiatoa sp. IS2]